ncbi:hypothetical protein TRFO_11141 [Tritrichomonas foetus]|uniref:Uncharacterized protein n=1 Tax=Tritrichomonas foetus TaxID=1144522 RepID=A0A1J4J8E3_9EUKA|nr:hypothetical protein TRFO_11141 [Tritrichomonas foetus]|eukprot:OHS94503.1 hypothetical protein TRFO_11141 [Tritrichomonas foetus]
MSLIFVLFPFLTIQVLQNDEEKLPKIIGRKENPILDNPIIMDFQSSQTDSESEETESELSESLSEIQKSSELVEDDSIICETVSTVFCPSESGFQDSNSETFSYGSEYPSETFGSQEEESTTAELTDDSENECTISYTVQCYTISETSESSSDETFTSVSNELESLSTDSFSSQTEFPLNEETQSTETELELETETKSILETESESEIETETTPKLETETESEIETETTPKLETETESEIETETKIKLETESESELETETDTETLISSETPTLPVQVITSESISPPIEESTPTSDSFSTFGSESAFDFSETLSTPTTYQPPTMTMKPTVPSTYDPLPETSVFDMALQDEYGPYSISNNRYIYGIYNNQFDILRLHSLMIEDGAAVQTRDLKINNYLVMKGKSRLEAIDGGGITFADLMEINLNGTDENLPFINLGLIGNLANTNISLNITLSISDINSQLLKSVYSDIGKRVISGKTLNCEYWKNKITSLSITPSTVSFDLICVNEGYSKILNGQDDIYPELLIDSYKMTSLNLKLAISEQVEPSLDFQQDKRDSISVGATIGIVIGVVAGVSAILVVVAFIFRKKRIIIEGADSESDVFDI